MVTKASTLVLAKMLPLLLCPQNPVLTSMYSHLGPNGDLVGSLLFVNATDSHAYKKGLDMFISPSFEIVFYYVLKNYSKLFIS